MTNEWLVFNLKPVLLAILAALQSLTASAGNIIAEGTVSSVPAATPTTVVAYTNALTTKVFISHIIGTGNFTGKWTIVMPNGSIITKRTAHQAPNLNESFIPAFLLDIGETVTVKIEHSDSAVNTFNGFILGYKLA